MGDRYTIGEIVAERQIQFVRSDGSAELVTVRIGKPVAGDYPEEWRCPYQIEAFGQARTHAMTGVDSVQALLLTMQTILPELEHIAKREGGSFSWLENPTFGFPDYTLSPSYQRRNEA